MTWPVESQPEASSGRRSLRGRMAAVRARVRGLPGGTLLWRIGVTLLGLAVIAVGIVLLPLPGPGWLIIFAGLGLLATEYEWASRLLRRGRDLLARWTRWVAARGAWARAAMLAMCGVFVVALIAGGWFVVLAV
jgi:uncharacterized protein (TIGR02611 family)